MKKKIWIIMIIVILGILVFTLHVFVLSREKTDDMANEHLQEPQQEQAVVGEQSITAKEVLEAVRNADDSIVLMQEQEVSYERGVYSWDTDILSPQNRAKMYITLGHLGIDEVYQDFEGVAADDQDALALAGELMLIDVDLFMLSGNSEWAQDASGAPMLKEIEKAIAFRDEWGPDALKGIVFDIEPHGSDLWKQGDRQEREAMLENLVAGMRIAYGEASNEGFRVIMCIPTWYDKHYGLFFNQLDELCDELSVMNYIREDEYINIAAEVEYARTRDMDITCIFEFQRVGTHDLTDANTYNNDGIDAGIGSFEALYQDFGYSKLKFAFHYLNPIQELLLDQ